MTKQPINQISSLNLPSIRLPVVDEMVVLTKRQKAELLHRITNYSNKLTLHTASILKNKQKYALNQQQVSNLRLQLKTLQTELCSLASYSRLDNSGDLNNYHSAKAKFFNSLVQYCKIIIKKDTEVY